MAVELDKERDKLVSMQTRLEDEQKLNRSFQQELGSLKDENKKILREMHKTREDLNQKISEIGSLQMELQRRDIEETDDNVVELKKLIATLEDETRNMKMKKDEFEAALKALRSCPARKDVPSDLNPLNKHASPMNEESPVKEEMQESLHKLERDLKEACRERDKVLHELNRLKQHLLEKFNSGFFYTPRSRDRFENGNSVPEQRISHSFSRTYTPAAHSPVVNDFDSSSNHEIQQYQTEIKRLQDSEAEIKALSVNYAALLKEKEEQILMLSQENGSLKQNLLTTNAALSTAKTVPKGSGNISPRHNKSATKVHTSGSPLSNGIAHELNNGIPFNNAKELPDQMDKNKSLNGMQATHETQMKQMAVELDKERDKLVSMQTRLEDEQKLNRSFQQELGSLKDENKKILREMHKTREDLNQKISEIGRLQMELQRRDIEETDDNVVELKKLIATLEDETRNMKKEKDEFEAALKALRSCPARKDVPSDLNPLNKHASPMNEESPVKEEMQESLHKLERDLKEACGERDKVLHELNRLKQHLLQKVSEESEKMDEDSKIIEELREINEHQRLDKALKQALGSQEEIKMSNINELKKATESIAELNRKLTGCMSTIDSKNMEVLNLQTALGQYYAEIEAKERLGEELLAAREEFLSCSNGFLTTDAVQEAHWQAEESQREKEDIIGKLSQAERILADGKNRVKKLEEDNEKLRRALEQSMTRLNRMSVDSNFLVDRRIVIKLLATYFQRNHSKEVLDLMVRMLGFSEEDKQRIGVAQQGAGKGIVRGVLGFPGRLVGGILGGGIAGGQADMASDDQSFADLWVDFLLKETEREKRVLAGSSNPDQGTTEASPSLDHRGGATSTMSNSPRPSPFLNQNQMPPHSRSNLMQHENSDSEFSTGLEVAS
ncbi:hypothetical protein OROMI_002451 [Orobanche minor]